MNHFDSSGNAVMVDISDKNITERIACAEDIISVSKEVFEAIINGTGKKAMYFL
jgi:cyclic pyranopterin phosphate synthase